MYKTAPIVWKTLTIMDNRSIINEDSVCFDHPVDENIAPEMMCRQEFDLSYDLRRFQLRCIRFVV